MPSAIGFRSLWESPFRGFGFRNLSASDGGAASQRLAGDDEPAASSRAKALLLEKKLVELSI